MTLGSDAAKPARANVPRWRRLLYVFALLALCVLAAELLMRLIYGSVELRRSYRWAVSTHLIDTTWSDYVRKQERVRKVRDRLGMERSRSHPIFGWTFNPGFRLDDPEVQLHVNSHGLRGEDFPLVKPPREIRILCLGGSTTAGEEVREAETYPAQLQAMLIARHPDLRLRVINGGVPAYDVPDSLRLYQVNQYRFGADIVTIYHGINDLYYHRTSDPDIRPEKNYTSRPATPFHYTDGSRQAGLLSPLLPYTDTLASRSYVFSALQQAALSASAGGAAPLPDPDPAGLEAFGRYYGALVRAIAGARATALPMTFELAWPGRFDDADRRRIDESLRPWLRAAKASPETAARIIDLQNDAIRRVARDEGLKVCEVAGRIPRDRRHFVDVMHLTAEGNRRIAELLAESLEPLIENLRSRSPASLEAHGEDL